MNTMLQSRLAIVDDHPLVRDGLRARLEVVPDFEVVGEAGSGAEALVLAHVTQPDLMLIDIRMKDMNGIELTTELHRRYPAIRVLVISMFDSLEYAIGAVRAGARGYVLKDSSAQEIIAAIRTVLLGGTHFSSKLARAIVAPQAKLTNREREVLLLVAQGYCNKTIGQQLGITHRAVETHRLNLRRKLNIYTTAGLVEYVMERRLDSDDSQC